MSKTLRNALIMLLVAIVIGVGGWYFLSGTSSRIAEQEVEQFLVKNNLQNKLTYSKIEATPTGKAKVKGVNLIDDEGDLVFTADEFNLTNYKETEDVFEIDFDFVNLVDVKGDKFQNELDKTFEDMDVVIPKSIDLAWSMQLDNNKQSSNFKPTVVIPNLFKIDFELNADSPSAFMQAIGMLNDAANSVDKEIDMLSLLNLASVIKLQDFSLTIENKGAMKPAIQAFKQQMLPGDSTPELEKQRQEFWDSHVKDTREECLSSESFALMSTNATKACDKIIDFMEAKTDKMRLKVALETPITIEELMMLALMGFSDDNFLLESKPTIEID
jgi:hypothetical protein